MPEPLPTPRISICLPTYNGARDLARLLPVLAAQRFGERPPALAAGELEIVAVDSSSSDDSARLLADAGARLEVIPQREFRHGATRNRIASRARGAILVFLSQDTLPEGERFLEHLAAPFSDPRLAGAWARVLPHEDDDPLTRRSALSRPEAGGAPRSFDLDGLEGLWQVELARRDEMLAFNDVASAIRADVWRALPFPDVAFGEDVAWAARALTAGHRLAFAASAVVRHAHRYSPRQAFERYRTDARFRRDTLGQRIRPNLWSVLRGFSFEVREDLRYLAEARGPGRLGGLLRSPFLRAAQVCGQYAGSRSEGLA